MNHQLTSGRREKGLRCTTYDNGLQQGASRETVERRHTPASPAWNRTTARPQATGRHGRRRYYHFQAGHGLACVPYCWNRAS
jgi:hypothetical protein